jgi:tRNA (guanine37-N1)-methyltransferase
MIFSILTLFPGIFDSPLKESITKKAVEKGIITFNIVNIRDFAEDAHKTCDDSPYGGGPGMVMKIEPIYRAMEHLEKTVGKPRYVLLSPQGRLFDEDSAVRYARGNHLCLVCGRYEGLDERVLNLVDEEVSIGDYILSGGEIPALVIMDAVTRCIPGVLGNDQSSLDESFSRGLLEYPQYTRPDKFMDMEVPALLLSGNHEEIRKWRRKEALRKTIFKRPDLMNRFIPNEEDRTLIREVMEDIPG